MKNTLPSFCAYYGEAVVHRRTAKSLLWTGMAQSTDDERSDHAIYEENDNNEELLVAFMGDYEVCYMEEKTSVSSVLDDNYSQYGHRNLSDYNAGTCWSPEDDNSGGIGEKTEVTVPGSEWEGVKITGLQIINGYGKTTALFRANNRARTITVRGGNRRYKVELLDTPQWQWVCFPAGINEKNL